MNEIQNHLANERDRLNKFRSECLKIRSPYNEKLFLDITRGRAYYRTNNNKYLGTIQNPKVQQLLMDGVVDSVVHEIDMRIEAIDTLCPVLKSIEISDINDNLAPAYRDYPRSFLKTLGLVDTESMLAAAESENPDYHPENL